MKPQSIPAPLGSIEPHAPLLNIPPEDRLLYKMMTIENLLRSVAGLYLHFNRVDGYVDFPGADPHDGQQLPHDVQGNSMARFEKSPEFSAADYYDQSRARTYACCFSLENSDFIWINYAKGSKRGKVCLVFDFGKLRATLNETLQPETAVLDNNGIRCRQVFTVNYGIVKYVDWDIYQANEARLTNPIRYTYLKNKRFSEEKELRISLSATGIGHFVLNDGSELDFPPSLHVVLDFRRAIADGTIQQILYAPDCDSGFLCAQLAKLGITPSEGSTGQLNEGKGERDK